MYFLKQNEQQNKKMPLCSTKNLFSCKWYKLTSTSLSKTKQNKTKKELKDSINWKRRRIMLQAAGTHCIPLTAPCMHTQTAIYTLPSKYTIHLSICSALFTQLLQGMKNALSVLGGETDPSKNLLNYHKQLPAWFQCIRLYLQAFFFFFKYTYTLKFLEKHTMLMYACISLCFSQKSHTSCAIKIASIPLPSHPPQ